MLQSNYGRSLNPALAFLADEKTKSKIHKHLNDINDVISEEDMQNIQTGNYEEVKKEVEKEENESAKDDGNNDNEIETVWNIKKH